MAKNRLPPGDDGHVIAPMNVEGMPWHKPERRETAGGAPPSAPLSGSESRWMIWGALKAALVVFAVFAAGICLFVALLLWLWR